MTTPTPTPRTPPARLAHGLGLLLVLAALGGCAAERLHREGLAALQAGQTDTALAQLRQATELEPGNARFRIDYLGQRALVLQAQNNRADELRLAGKPEAAQAAYAQVLRADASNERAQAGLRALQQQRRADQLLQQAERAVKDKRPEQAVALLREGLRDMPGNFSLAQRLQALEEQAETERQDHERRQAAQAAFRRPVTLQFRDANLKMVFEALSRTAGVNIILDRDVKSDLRTTIYVKDASVEDTIDLILLQNQLDKRVLNHNTMFVYPATAPKQREYSELKVRSFQISNADAQHLGNVIKTLLKAKDIVTDPKTNTLVMRDTVETLAVAEKIIAANDRPDAEVMLEVEVMEVSRDRLSNLGVKWPEAIAVATPKGAATVGDLRALTRDDLLVTPLSLGLNLMLQDTDTNILASPRIRTRNKEKARILVGDKVPVITNLLTPQQAGQTSVITGSIQYVDVGIKLEVEPQVYADGDVGIKVNLEVSSIVKPVETSSGIAYQIGTRGAQTSLRLRDGETQVLAGLINDQDRNAASKVPGLGQIPLLGRLFSSNNGTASKSEVVLSITPRILRPQSVPEARVADVWSGTEAVVRDKPLRLDPIGAAVGGAPADIDSARRARTGSAAGAASGAAPGGAAAPAPSGAATAPKAGGAGGSSILNAARPPTALPGANTGGGTAAPDDAAGTPRSDTGNTPNNAANGTPTGTATSATPGTTAAGGNAGATGTNSGATGGGAPLGTATTPTPARRPPPPSIQPGRAMTPANPSAPPGTNPPTKP